MYGKSSVLTTWILVLTGAELAAFSVPLARADALVISRDNNSILRYSDSGAFIGTFVPPGGGGLNGPDLGIVRGPDGNVYVDSFINSAVMRYDVNTGANLPSPPNSGAQFVASGSGGLSGADGISFGRPGGALYIASTLNSTVKRYNPTTGAFLDTIVTSGSGGLSASTDLHFGPDGNLYVSNFARSGPAQVLRYDSSTGTPMPAAGRMMANFIDPRPGFATNGFAFGPDGNLYVSFDNFQDNTAGIGKYDGATGNLINLDFVPLGSGGVGRIDGIVFGPDGNLYATDVLNNRVMRYGGTNGDFLGVFIAPGNGLSAAAGILFVPAPVPEPATLALFGLGTLGVLAYAWRRRTHRREAVALSSTQTCALSGT
jgi:sugar lactone lactonase YvrE